MYLADPKWNLNNNSDPFDLNTLDRLFLLVSRSNLECIVLYVLHILLRQTESSWSWPFFLFVNFQKVGDVNEKFFTDVMKIDIFVTWLRRYCCQLQIGKILPFLGSSCFFRGNWILTK